MRQRTCSTNVGRDAGQIRAGLHVGDLMSGVVGLRMPQFTVFGDTVPALEATPGQIYGFFS